MVSKSKHTKNKVKETNVCSKENNDVVGELLEIDELHRFQKWIDQAQSSTDTPTSINVNQERIKQNCAELELTNNVKDKNINDQINESIKISITIMIYHPTVCFWAILDIYPLIPIFTSKHKFQKVPMRFLA